MKASDVEKHNMDHASESKCIVGRDKESNIRVITLSISIKIKKNIADAIGVNNACRVINEIMSE